METQEEKYRFEEKKKHRILRTYKQKYLYFLNAIDASYWYVFDINVSSVPVTNVLQEAKCLDS